MILKTRQKLPLLIGFLFSAIFFLSGGSSFAKDQVDVVKNGWYNTSFPVPVMHLEGSFNQTAIAHGSFVARDSKNKKSLDFYTKMLEERVLRIRSLDEHPFFKNIVLRVFHFFVRDVMIKHVPENYLDAYRDFAHASGFSEEALYNVLVLPDSLLRILGLFNSREVVSDWPSGLGCTSVIWNQSGTSALHGRNLDYEGVGIWDKSPLLLHIVPDQGLAHVAVTSLGIHTNGLTAFNEAGLSLAIHQLTFSDAQSSGTPMPIIASEVIRNSRNIDDAITIIRSFPRAGAWAYVLSQGVDRAVVEAGPNQVSIRRSSENFFFQTNHVSSPALAKFEIFGSPGYWLDSHDRANALQGFKKSPASKSWATSADMAEILSGYKIQKRMAYGTIAKVDNVTSVIMDPHHRRILIGLSQGDLAPNEGQYIEYAWRDLRSAEPPQVRKGVSSHGLDSLGANAITLRGILRRSMNANLSFVERVNVLSTYTQEVKRFEDHLPSGASSGVLMYVWAYLKLKSKTQKELNTEALTALNAAIDVALRDPFFLEKDEYLDGISQSHRKALLRFTKGMLLDLANEHSKASLEYLSAKELTSFTRLRKTLENLTLSPFELKEASSFTIDWGGFDLYRYPR